MTRRSAAVLCAMLILIPAHADATAATPLATPTSSSQASATPWDNLIYDTVEVLKEDSEGDAVVLLQERLSGLGFFNFKPTGFYGTSTKEAVQAFQREHALPPDGECGPQTAQLLFGNTAARGYGPRGKPLPVPKRGASAIGRYGEMIEWDKVKRLVAPRTQTITLIDCATGRKWNAVRLGGDLHMDIEPKTKKDTAIMKEVVGGRWTWNRRPVLVKIGSKEYAGSINSYPHSPQRVADNNFDGHHCLHFYKSRVHKTGNMDPEHQRCVKKAAGK